MIQVIFHIVVKMKTSVAINHLLDVFVFFPAEFHKFRKLINKRLNVLLFAVISRIKILLYFFYIFRFVVVFSCCFV